MDILCQIQLCGYINDTYNASYNVGHRTSMLDIKANQISFGQCGGYSAASIYKASTNLGNNENFYAFPTPGYFPIDDFEMTSDSGIDKLRDTKWSITIANTSYVIDRNELELKMIYNGKTYNITDFSYDAYTKTIYWNIPADLKSQLTEGTSKLVAGKKVDVELKGLQDASYNGITIKYWTEFFVANPKEVTGYRVYFDDIANENAKGEQSCTATEGDEKTVTVQVLPYDAQDKRYII